MLSRNCFRKYTSRLNFPSFPHKFFTPKPNCSPRVVTAVDALSIVNSDTDIYVHTLAGTPTVLLEALCNQVSKNNLNNIRLSHVLLGERNTVFLPEYHGKIRSNCLFVCNGSRSNVNAGAADYTPVFLSEIPQLYSSGALNVDVALITVSPPDEQGYCSFGINVDCSFTAAASAKQIIAVINPKMPRTKGYSSIHISHLHSIVESDCPIAHLPENLGISSVEKKIGEIIANNLVDNGATLQLGIGAIPDATLSAMGEHKDLGIHTEMFSDGVANLMNLGVINNSKKTFLPGKTVTSFAFGTEKLYREIDNNSDYYFAPCEFTNNSDVIRQNCKMTSINSALEIDLTGQIVSDSIGSRIFSGFAGQVDFMAATPHSFDGAGKAIIALPSRTSSGKSKIVPFLKKGSGVVTTRAHARYIVTEYGIAHLWGKSIRQRAHQLINISHPDDRENLEKAAFDFLKVMPSL